jgi:hypothetical protein
MIARLIVLVASDLVSISSLCPPSLGMAPSGRDCGKGLH